MASRYPAETPPGRPAPHRRSLRLRPTGEPQAPPEEIGPVRDLIDRLKSAVDRGSFGPGLLENRIAAEKRAAPTRSPSPDRSATLDLGVWSPRETHRFLDTLLSLRAIGGPRPTGREAIAIGVSQWLTDRDRIVLNDLGLDFFLSGGGDREHALRVLHAEQQPGTASPGTHRINPVTGAAVIKRAAPAALEAVMTARRLATPDIVVACLEGTTDAPGSIADAFDLAARLRLPLLFVGEFLSSTRPRSGPGMSAAAHLAARHDWATGRADATDIIAISETAGDLIHAVRCGGPPGYLEIELPDDAIPAGPIRRLSDAMIARGDITAAQAAAKATSINEEVASLSQRIEQPAQRSGGLPR